MTGIGAAFLAPERLAERGLTPSSLTYAPTGERVASAARLRELRATDPGGLVIIKLLDEDDPADRELLLRSLTFPGAIVASDAMPLTWTGPAPDPLSLAAARGPRSRTRGPRARSRRALRLLTRDAGGPLSLTEALASAACSRRGCWTTAVPAMRRKGRLPPAATPTSSCSTRPRSATRPPTATAPGRRPGSGTSWSTARSWCATATSWPDALPGQPVRADPR